jgi:uncharacterized membrane protein YadS
MSLVSNTQSIRRPNGVTASPARHAGAHDEGVAYAVACVTVFGSVAMLAYLLLSGLLQLDLGFDLWSGASIQEIAQGMAASLQNGQKAGELAALARMTRGMILAPMVVALRGLANRRANESQPRALRNLREQARPPACATGRKSSEAAPRLPG